MHSHTNGQLNFVDKGTMRLVTSNSSWIIPQKRLVWIPPDHPHSVRCQGLSGSWKTMIPRSYRKFLPNKVCVLKTSNLLKAALEDLPEYENSISNKKLRLLINVIKMELRAAESEKFGVTFPKSQRLTQICDYLLEHPDDSRTLDEWAKAVGMSRRTLIRAFSSETGSPFAAWKRAFFLEKSLEFLAEGMTVNETADKLGYSEPSAFVAAFWKRFGVTPGQFFK